MIVDPLTYNAKPIHAARRPKGLLKAFLGVSVGATLLLSGVGTAWGVTIPADPDEAPVPPDASGVAAKRAEVKSIAREELSKRVSENRSDNVPRYRNGKGRVTPYSISDQWCAAFATWTWGQAGFDAFRTEDKQPRFLRTAFGGEEVAIQVRDLRNWAIRTNRRTLRATPGDLVAYGDRHIGIVMQVNRDRRAILAIEGNLTDRVRWFRIPMTDIIDYFRPVPLSTAQRATRSILRPDVG